ncbi:unnamed protein product [Phytomonas sp. Hart1]|nr:unnamed protein product [Phytomonas sp. Hart1]|eukprot:CCW67501.1 unnamed protein product [Phytomonas sp. isolate Hart1]
MPPLSSSSQNTTKTPATSHAVGDHHRRLLAFLRSRRGRPRRAAITRDPPLAAAVAVIPIREFILSTLTALPTGGDEGFELGRRDLAGCVEYFDFFDRFFDITCGDQTTVGFFHEV